MWCWPSGRSGRAPQSTQEMGVGATGTASTGGAGSWPDGLELKTFPVPWEWHQPPHAQLLLLLLAMSKQRSRFFPASFACSERLSRLSGAVFLYFLPHCVALVLSACWRLPGDGEVPNLRGGHLDLMLRKKLLVCVNETTPLRFKIAFYLSFQATVFLSF